MRAAAFGGAMPVFGQLMTGLPANDPMAVTAGWVYHFWNGISFGMMFVLFKPNGGVFAGLLWGFSLQCLMLLAYPQLLGLRLSDPAFISISLIGHAAWGAVLGWAVRKWKIT